MNRQYAKLKYIEYNIQITHENKQGLTLLISLDQDIPQESMEKLYKELQPHASDTYFSVLIIVKRAGRRSSIQEFNLSLLNNIMIIPKIVNYNFKIMQLVFEPFGKVFLVKDKQYMSQLYMNLG